MKKIIIILLVVSILAGCQSPQPSFVSQIDHLSKSIVKKKELLVQRVEETGSTSLGNSLLEISDKLTNQTNYLIEKIRNGSLPKIENIDVISNIHYPTVLHLRIQRNDQLLCESYKEFVDKDNRELFILSLLMYNENVLSNIVDFYFATLQCFDYLNPVVLSERFEIKQGEVFEGIVLTQGGLLREPFIYKYDDPQTDEGLVRISSNSKNVPGGLIRIVGTKVGTHEIKVTSTITRNGKDDTYYNGFTLKVIE